MKTTLSTLQIIMLFILAAIFITSCKKNDEFQDAEGYLNAEEKSWLSYAGGEMLIFQRDSTLTDTFWVGNRVSFRNVGNQQFYPCMHHQEVVRFYITDSTGTNFYLEVSHSNQWVSGDAGISIDGVHVESFTQHSPQDNIIIHGNTYNSVYVISSDTTSFQSPEVWRLYYTKLNGILRFDITHGQQWEKIN